MYYLEDGLGGYKGMKLVGKILAVIFALCAILASFGPALWSEESR